MNGKKWKIIKSSVGVYKTLPEDKQMFVLGFMQGVLSSQQKETKKKVKNSQKDLGLQQLSISDFEL